MASLPTPDATTLATIASLEHRLQRLTFYLIGDTELPAQLLLGPERAHKASAFARLTSLQHDLAELALKKPSIKNLIELQANFPNLFHPTTSSPLPPTTLTPEELLAIITASAPEYHQTASRLTALEDLPLPPADSSSALIALVPRLGELELAQEAQDREIAELRERSARVIQMWYEAGVLGQGECWGEWEARVSEVEKFVRRREVVRRRDEEEGMVYERGSAREKGHDLSGKSVSFPGDQ